MLNIGLARKYALALFEISPLGQDRLSVLNSLSTIWGLLSHKSFKPLLSKLSPKSIKYTLLSALLSESEPTQSITSFLKVLSKDNKMHLLGKIVDFYNELMLREQNRFCLVFTTSAKATSDDMEALRNALPESGLNFEIINMEDPSILSGFLLKIGNTFLDCSLNTMLRELHKSIQNYDIGTR